MASKETILEFLRTWEKRRTGELPQPDLTVTCSMCGVQILGDMRIEYGKTGLVCGTCFFKNVIF